MSSSSFRPGASLVQEIRNIGCLKSTFVAPTPYNIELLDSEGDRERAAAVTFIVNSHWLAPDSERTLAGTENKFAARVIEITNAAQSSRWTIEDERYCRITFVSNYEVNDVIMARLRSALSKFEVDFEVIFSMSNRIQILHPKSPIRFGAGLIARVERVGWRERHNARQEQKRAAEEERRREEMIAAAFADPTKAMCVSTSQITPSLPPTASTRIRASASDADSVQHFSASSGLPGGMHASMRTNIFKQPRRQLNHHTVAQHYKKSKDGALKRVVDWWFNVSPSDLEAM